MLGLVEATRAVESMKRHQRAVAAEYLSHWVAVQVDATRQRGRGSQCNGSAGGFGFRAELDSLVVVEKIVSTHGMSKKPTVDGLRDIGPDCWRATLRSGARPARQPLMFINQENDPAALAAVVELQVLALVLVAGGRAVAVCEGEAV